MFNISWKNLFFKKRLHHFLKITFPFCAMGFGFMFMLVPGIQVRKFMYGSYQESILVQVVINRYTVAFTIMRGPVITKLAVAVA